MWSCESTERQVCGGSGGWGGWGGWGGCGGWSGSEATSTTSTSTTSLACFSSHLAVRIRVVGVVGQEQYARAAGREPAGEHARGSRLSGRLGEHRLQPAADVAQLGGATAQHGDDGAESETGAQEVRDGVDALREDI